jgi:UDP-N-acetylmuramate--alanine ligase
MSRAKLLGKLMKNYHTPIAVAGTHGKTSTTGMISEVLTSAELDPTLTIGGIMNTIGSNLRLGKSGYFITEACEYADSYLDFFPRIGLILNIEADHLDYFKSLDAVRQSFSDFASLIPEDGALIINGDIDDVASIIATHRCKVITFGLNNNNDYRIDDISYDVNACPTFSLHCKGETVPRCYTLGTPGEHNVLNAVATIAVADFLEVDNGVTAKALAAFTGVERRFEIKGNINGFTIIDDYAHHPTEVAVTLSTARRYPHREIWCAFQPHTYTRTKAFKKEFAEALCLADKVLVVDIYAAREKDENEINSTDLMEAVRAHGGECYYVPTADGFFKAEKFLFENLRPDDLLITMGAGDVFNIGENMLMKK